MPSIYFLVDLKISTLIRSITHLVLFTKVSKMTTLIISTNQTSTTGVTLPCDFAQTSPNHKEA